LFSIRSNSDSADAVEMPRPLQLSDFTALSVDLGAHPLDFAADKIKPHGVPVRPRPFQFAGEQWSSADLPVREVAGRSKGV
jgi:hypothetical protein